MGRSRSWKSSELVSFHCRLTSNQLISIIGAPNTTGAYEMDLASISNFTQLWRPMHVKTDIFCAAGLLLPDKAGRQIITGGWSGDSTFGIRLYTPDGSAGVWGTNDWQEDGKSVYLQDGRWYPTNMIMANGSILGKMYRSTTLLSTG